jgi:tetratricopeptide (TPR) repeat protein
MMNRKTLWGQLGGTVWGIPVLLLFALLSPLPWMSILSATLLLITLAAQMLPLLTVPEAARSFRLASQEKWAQARYYNILAQHKLKKSPWKGGWRLFRGPYQPPTLAMTLRADQGRLLLGLGQHRQAELALRAALKEFPKDAATYHNLALALSLQGKYRQARIALEQAVSMGFIPPAQEILWRWPLARLGRKAPLRNEESCVTFYQRLGFHRIALSCLSLSGNPSACWRRTISLLALGRLEQARREVMAELNRHPKSSHAWLAFGFLAAQQGRLEQAEASYRKAVALDRTNLAAKEQLYLLLARRSEPRRLLNAIAVLEEHESEPTHLAFGRAILLAGLDRWPEALKEISAAGPALRCLTLLELAAYGNLRLGHNRAGCRLLHRFCTLAEVSGVPMLARDQRLLAARETLRRFRRIERETRQDTPQI